MRLIKLAIKGFMERRAMNKQMTLWEQQVAALQANEQLLNAIEAEQKH